MASENEKISTKFVRLPINVTGADVSDDIRITLTALEAIENVRKDKKVPKEYYLRIGVRAGINKNYSFSLTFDDEPDESDRILKSDFIEVLVDSRTLFYAMGLTIDYDRNEEKEGFVFRWEDY